MDGAAAGWSFASSCMELAAAPPSSAVSGVLLLVGRQPGREGRRQEGSLRASAIWECGGTPVNTPEEPEGT
jgi:hypothetical protein